jgi:hypothetical protein
MKTGLQLSFRKNAIAGEFCLNLFENYVKFLPSRFTKKHRTRPWDEKRHKREIRQMSLDESVIVSDNENNIFLTTDTGSNNPHRSIRIVQDQKWFNLTDLKIYEAINHNGFVSGYLFNEDYENVQSSVFSSNLEGRNYSKEMLDTIKNTPSREQMWGGKEYDTKFNPGRSVLISYTWLMVGWKMWFGEDFFKIVPKEKILSFPYAIECAELSGGNVYIQLFDKLEEPYNPDAIFRQWKWREWMQYDDLEKDFS